MTTLAGSTRCTLHRNLQWGGEPYVTPLDPSWGGEPYVTPLDPSQPRTIEYLERQTRGGFRAFVQVRGLGCIDLGDRRSGVQISAARQQERQVGPVRRVLSLCCVFCCTRGLIAAGCPRRVSVCFVDQFLWDCDS